MPKVLAVRTSMVDGTISELISDPAGSYWRDVLARSCSHCDGPYRPKRPRQHICGWCKRGNVGD